MVILDCHILWPGGSRGPFEANSPLVVDSNAVRPGSVAFQLLQPMSRKVGDVAQAVRGFESIKGSFRLTAKGIELLDPFSL
jgi:hypothetical protein